MKFLSVEGGDDENGPMRLPIMQQDGEICLVIAIDVSRAHNYCHAVGQHSYSVSPPRRCLRDEETEVSLSTPIHFGLQTACNGLTNLIQGVFLQEVKSSDPTLRHVLPLAMRALIASSAMSPG